MSSWRITTILIDRSQISIPKNGTTGAMVIRAPKGTEVPILVDVGQTDRIIDLFGSPSTDYPDVWEAIQYNKYNPLWIAAPYSTADATFGGALLTNVGSASLSTGLKKSEIATYTFPTPSVLITDTIGTGDDSNLTFTKVLSKTPVTPTSSNFDIYKNGVDMAVTVGTAVAGVYPITHASLDTGSQYDSNTRTLTLVFLIAPGLTDTYTVKYQTTATCFVLLLARSPYIDDLSIRSSYDTINSLFNVNLYKLNSYGDFNLLKTYSFSLTEGSKDGFGKPNYIEDVFTDDDYLQYKVNTGASVSNVTNDTTYIAFGGGSRDKTDLTTAMIVTTWDQFKSARKYAAKYFMSTVSDSTIVSKFVELRTGFQPFAKYILPLPQSGSASSAITTKEGYGVDERGLRFYWNWIKAKTIYGTFWTSGVSGVGTKHALMKDVYFGLAPAWIDENKHGGQLGDYLDNAVKETAYDPTESELQALDEAGINPIVLDQAYGPMIVSQRTGQNPNKLSDTSWIGHSDVIDYIFENIIGSVLTAQICKLNDPTHRSLVLSKANGITTPIKQASILRDVANKCDKGNNGDAVLAQRQFVLTTAIQVTPFSERIQFNLIATEQTVTIQQVLA